MRPTSALGYDVVLAIDPEVYTLSRTGDGVGYAFQMADETRQQLTAGIKHAVDRPQDIENLEIHPGYIRVQVEPSPDVSPKEFIEDLRNLASVYNQRYAKDPALEGIRFSDSYVATYRAESAPTVERFLDRRTGFDDAPDEDGPVFEYYRNREQNPDSDRYLSYEFVFSLDAVEMYSTTHHFQKRTRGFEWTDAVRDVLNMVVENVSVWPGSRPDAITAVQIYPEYVKVQTVNNAINRSAVGLAKKVADALLVYNRHRPARDDDSNPLTRKLALTDDVYIGASPPDKAGADEWIERNGLSEVDGEPREPEPDVELDGETDSSGLWSVLNPFGE